jgi:metal-responsive CopG/Arc/MetJ family transcriptional regulator
MLLNISTTVKAMATVNFSVPEDIKNAFNKTFKGENKSAILSRLMRDAIEKRERQQRRKAAVEAILHLRDHSSTVSDEDIHTLRTVGRP